jgi:hypothetical protein
VNLEQIRATVALCEFEGFNFDVIQTGDCQYLVAAWLEPCIATGKPALQKSRKWLLSSHMTRSEIVQTCFKLALTAVEHRTRESFTYRGRRIFGPHFDVDALHQLCTDRRFDVRRSS